MKRSTALKYYAMEHVVQPLAVRALTGIERLRTGVTYNPLAPQYRTDPYPLYRRLRERDPFHRSRLAGGWILTRYNDVAAVLRDGRFHADDRKLPFQVKQRKQFIKDGLMEPDEALSPSMLRSDPPDHTRLRGLVSKAFTPRTIEALRPRIEAVVQELLDQAATNGSMDVIRDLAYPLPVIVIAEMLGVPTEDREQFKRWSDDAVASFGIGTLHDFIRSRDAFRALQAYFAHVAEERRREPREDLLSALLAAEQEGDKLTTDEVFATCILLLVAGNETTTNLIGNGLLALLRHPDQLALLRDDPALMEGAVEEMLRYDSPVQATSRFVEEDRRGERQRRSGRTAGDRAPWCGEPRSGAVPRAGPAGHLASGQPPPVVRAWHPLLPGRAARAPRGARRVPGAARALPQPAPHEWPSRLGRQPDPARPQVVARRPLARGRRAPCVTMASL